MALYCGIDLHSRDCWLAILDEGQKVVQQAKVGNDLEALLQMLEPFREDMKDQVDFDPERDFG
jgi:transposase